MLTYPWKCTVLHCNHLGNTWKPLVLMTRHFDYCLSASEGDNQSVRSSAPVVSRCFPGGYNVKLYISRGRLAWWLLAFLHSAGPPVTATHVLQYPRWNWNLHSKKFPSSYNNPMESSSQVGGDFIKPGKPSRKVSVASPTNPCTGFYPSLTASTQP